MRTRRVGWSLKTLMIAVIGLAAAVGIAACGGGGGGIEGGGSTEVETVELKAKPSGDLTISTWALYIDKKTVPNFEKAAGIKVNYIEDVNSNTEYFNKMQPLLARGESGGRSIMVLIDWQVARMHELGYLQDLDKSALPNVEKNLAKPFRHKRFDPERNYTVPYESGMTGIIVNTDLAPDIHSVCDMFNPKYKGKVDFLADPRETVPMVMKCEGVDPETATEADWMKAIEKIKGAAESGQIRRFTGLDYIADLSSGNAVAVTGYSGGATLLHRESPKLVFRMPTEGCLLWSEDMVIPTGAPNPTAAEAFMNYVYIPEVQANIIEYVQYVTPVEGVKEVLEKRNSELADNQLIFPSASFIKNCSDIPIIKGEEEQNILHAFAAVLNE